MKNVSFPFHGRRYSLAAVALVAANLEASKMQRLDGPAYEAAAARHVAYCEIHIDAKLAEGIEPEPLG